MRSLSALLFAGVIFASVESMAFVPASGGPRSGVYIGGTMGADLMKSKIGKKSLFKSNEYDDEALNGTLAFGVRALDVRFAAEFNMNTKADFGDYEYEYKNLSGQLYYDLPIRGSKLRPFLNFGFGYHWSNIKTKPGIDEDIDVWAWNAGAGISYYATRRVNVDLGYRYIDLGDEAFKDSDRQNVKFKSKHHQVYMGWRYVF